MCFVSTKLKTGALEDQLWEWFQALERLEFMKKINMQGPAWRMMPTGKWEVIPGSLLSGRANTR